MASAQWPAWGLVLGWHRRRRPPTSSRRRDAGRLSANSTIRITEASTDRVPSWGSAGEWMKAATDGIDHGGDRDEQHHADVLGAWHVDVLRAVLQPAGDEGEAEDEEQVGEDRADERGLDDRDQAGLQREQGDEQLGQVAEGRLQDAGRAGPEPVTELLDRPSDDGCEQGDGDSRAGEGEELATADVAGESCPDDRRGREAEQDQVGPVQACRPGAQPWSRSSCGPVLQRTPAALSRPARGGPCRRRSGSRRPPRGR